MIKTMAVIKTTGMAKHITRTVAYHGIKRAGIKAAGFLGLLHNPLSWVIIAIIGYLAFRLVGKLIKQFMFRFHS